MRRFHEWLNDPTRTVTALRVRRGRATYPDSMATDKSTLPTTEDEWRVRLTPAEFRVLRQAGTEPAWSGEYVDTKTRGMYQCRACGADLYPSDTKFDSHCGWPSFDDIVPGSVREIEDRQFGMVRTEIRCANCDSHLGHVFRGEWMTDKNTRHCVNSLSIRLNPDAAQA
jgi:peptide-methionine (R)-S-oxide reductase